MVRSLSRPSPGRPGAAHGPGSKSAVPEQAPSCPPNKIDGIRCALAHEPYSAHQSVEHDDANVIAMGSWLVPRAMVPEIVRQFLDAAFDDTEDTRSRVGKLHDLERGGLHALHRD